MDTRIFGEAYVSLDRLALYRLRESGQLAKILAQVERQLQPAAADLAALCDAGCDREEMLWFLSGCWYGPAFPSVEKLLGRHERALTSGLTTLRRSADLIADMNAIPFGLFLLGATGAHDFLRLPSMLREYASLVAGAKATFRRGSHWYLHLAKARMVDHVKACTGAYRDKQVSSLLNEMIQTEERSYSEADHAKWRSRYYQAFSGLDPATTWSPDRRAQAAHDLETAAAEIPQVGLAIERMLAAYTTLLNPRLSPPQKPARKRS
jgi:hypothetical protein